MIDFTQTTRTSTGCWLYEGVINSYRGYGVFRRDGRNLPAHRAAWEFVNGPIPAGLDIDHICHNADTNCPGGPTCLHRRCVNPAHLEAVTRSENVKRGRMGNRGAHQECKHGHGPLEKLSDGRWGCRPCKNERNRAYRARRAA